MKVVTFCHMHPKEKPSGSGWVAWYLAHDLAQNFGDETYFFGGRRGQNWPVLVEKLADEPVGEYLIDVSANSFARTQMDRQVLYAALRKKIEAINPDIIHFHSIHTMGLGLLEALQPVKAKQLMTLHNYVPICMNNGWLMTPRAFNPCLGRGPEACHSCFPQISVQAFQIHKGLASKLLNGLDMLTIPGEFARQRYLDWGIAESKLRYIPNGTDIESCSCEPLDSPVMHLGYFGQIGIHKGLDVLLAAINLLPYSLRESGRLHVHIFGSNLPKRNEAPLPSLYNQVLPSEYLERLFSQLDTIKDIVTLHGAYDHAQLPELLAKVDLVVVPSVWWENKPCIIQESMACKRPVLCSNIGGMVEMVRDGVDGLHFEAGNPHDLKNKILQLCNFPSQLQDLRLGIVPQRTVREMTEDFHALYEELLA